MFFKHNQLYIYNTRSCMTQSFIITESKYTLAHATADRQNIYVATVDSGFLIKVNICEKRRMVMHFKKFW